MKKLVLLLCLLIPFVAYAGFNDFQWSGFTLGGGTCQEQKPVLTVTPTSYAFGNVSSTKTRTTNIALSNTGNAALTGITFGAFSSAVFSHSSSASAPCGTTLAAKATCNRKVSFTPAAATTYNNVLVVSSNQLDDVTVGVSGTGTSAVTYGFTGQNLMTDFTNNVVAGSNQGFWMQKVATTTGTISYIHMHMLGANGNFNAAIYDNDGNKLSESNLKAVNVSVDTRIDFTLDTPITVTQGATYKIFVWVGTEEGGAWRGYRKVVGTSQGKLSVPFTIGDTMPTTLPPNGTDSLYEYNLWADNIATGGE